MTPTQNKASGEAGFTVAGWQAETTQEYTPEQANTDAAALNSRSTSTEASVKSSSCYRARMERYVLIGRVEAA